MRIFSHIPPLLPRGGINSVRRLNSTMERSSLSLLTPILKTFVYLSEHGFQLRSLFTSRARRRLPANLFTRARLRGWRPFLAYIRRATRYRGHRAAQSFVRRRPRHTRGNLDNQAEGEEEGSRAKIIIGEFRRWKIYRPCLPSSSSFFFFCAGVKFFFSREIVKNWINNVEHQFK